MGSDILDRCVSYNILDYGAVGDGVIDNTQVIQKAIDECSQHGGGTVLVYGGRFLTYTLNIKSGVRLEIDVTATLVGGTDPELYPEIPDNESWKPGHCSRLNRRTLFYAENAKNIGICGRGTIYGSGEEFMIRDEKEYPFLRHWQRKHDTLIPGRAILFVGCEDTVIEDVTIINSAGWTMWLLDCDRCDINHIKIDCDFRIPNVDGIHISACRDVTISDCFIRSSDDAIILRSHQEQLYKPKPCERVVVTNCTLQSGSSAIRIGWSNDYEIKNCSFSNLVIRNSFCGFSILIPAITEKQYDPPRGPDTPQPPEVSPFYVENILLNNIIMEVETCFMNINLSAGMSIRGVKNVSFNNINATCGTYPFINSQPEYGVEGISLNNVQLTLQPVRRHDLKEYRCFRSSMEFDNVENLTFDRFTIKHGITPRCPADITKI